MAISPTLYQRSILSLPEEVNLFLGGGRGGSKTFCQMFLALKHAEKYAALSRQVYIRETYEAVSQAEDEFEALCLQVYGPGKVRHNRSDGEFTFPNGAIMTFGALAEQKHYSKWQGRSFSGIFIDEYGLLTTTKWVTLLFSNLRGPKKVPKRVVIAANPGGAQHGELHHNYIVKSPPWVPYEKDGETWINCPSTWRDNPTLDAVSYLRKLKAACGNDAALFKAWDEGDWNIARGAYFAGALDEKVHMLSDKQCPVRKLPRDWLPFISMDFGSGAPSIIYICGESPGVTGYPKGSLILFDELAVCDENDLSLGLHWSLLQLSEAIKELCKPWECPTQGISDESYGLQSTLIEELGAMEIYVTLPLKQRVAGWQLMRNMLVNAKEQNGKPGLWVSERCRYFWRTVGFLQRDEKRIEDLNSKGNDHGADACRFACMHVGHAAFSTSITGGF
jgi:terminase large subunit-like protein